MVSVTAFQVLVCSGLSGILPLRNARVRVCAYGFFTSDAPIINGKARTNSGGGAVGSKGPPLKEISPGVRSVSAVTECTLGWMLIATELAEFAAKEQADNWS